MLGLTLIVGLKEVLTAMSQRAEKLQTVEFVSLVTLIRGIDRNLHRNLRKIRS
jgi:hypothetical protein